jgi:hypothetical protein
VHVPQANNDAGWCSHCGVYAGPCASCPSCGALFAFSTAAYGAAQGVTVTAADNTRRRAGLLLLAIAVALVAVAILLKTHPAWQQQLRTEIQHSLQQFQKPVSPAHPKQK